MTEEMTASAAFGAALLDADDHSLIEAANRCIHVFRREGKLWRLDSVQGTPIAEASA